MTITWENVEFDGPCLIEECRPPYRAGIYAIMMRSDPINRPNRYRILYFGESGNLSERDFNSSHHKYSCWLRNAGSKDNLFVGFHLMPNSTTGQRHQIESRLVREYSPRCND